MSIEGDLLAITQNVNNELQLLFNAYHSANCEWSDNCYDCFMNNHTLEITRIGEQFVQHVENAAYTMRDAMNNMNAAMQQL